MKNFVPIFEKDGNAFFVLLKDWRADDEHGARMIGWGAMLVETVLWKAMFTKEVKEISAGIEHREADLAGFPVAIISGPLVEELKEDKKDDSRREIRGSNIRG
ncbi:MAG TPA: hypothetical protein VJ521_16855 [Acidobacteriota bacterium]|nr:hypothetical protein [Acidobacteriota bacterium]